MSNGWIGVDLDGTLAEYHPGQGGVIGPPIPLMVARVKRWIADGRDVRIFTARVGSPVRDHLELVAMAQNHGDIQRWCMEHLGCILPITATKDYHMSVLYDDRAVQVVPNEGITIEEKIKGDAFRAFMAGMRKGV